MYIGIFWNSIKKIIDISCDISFSFIWKHCIFAFAIAETTPAISEQTPSYKIMLRQMSNNALEIFFFDQF